MSDILKTFKFSDDGKFIIMTERNWLFENDKDNDGFTPRPVPFEKFKFVFIGKLADYLNTDFNITKYIGEANDAVTNKFRNKYDFAIQITYPYLGSDDSKLGKDVISLFLVDKQQEVLAYQRIWKEI